MQTIQNTGHNVNPDEEGFYQKGEAENKISKFFMDCFKIIYEKLEGKKAQSFSDLVSSESFIKKIWTLDKDLVVEFSGGGDSGDIDSIPESIGFPEIESLIGEFVADHVTWDWYNNDGGYVRLSINFFNQRASITGAYYVRDEHDQGEQTYKTESFINFKAPNNDSF